MQYKYTGAVVTETSKTQPEPQQHIAQPRPTNFWPIFTLCSLQLHCDLPYICLYASQ